MGVFRKRILIVYCVMMLVIVALVGRLYYVQIHMGEAYAELARQQQERRIVIPAARGDILDRNGDKLAFSVRKYSVWAQKDKITKYTETVALIADTVNMDAAAAVDKLLKAQTTFVKIATGLTKNEADLIRAKEIYGISITEDTKRAYPYGALASSVIGMVNADGDGILGMELAFNQQLSGKSGMLHVTTDVKGRQLAYGTERLEAPDDGRVYMTTIDDTIQYKVEERIAEALKLHSAKRVSAIVMNPETGEICAMASHPTFDLNAPRLHEDVPDEAWNAMTAQEKVEYWNENWRNKVISDTYEPGSTFKAITAGIALEEKLVSLNSSFTCKGFKEIDGVRLHCVSYPGNHGVQDLTQAFVNSCNPAFMEIGARIGAERMYTYLETFGLLDKTHIDLPAESRGLFLDAQTVKPIELATMSYGHGLSVTMLQMARTLSALVNGGELMKPQIIKAILDSDGQVVEEIQPEVIRRVVSEETSSTLRGLLKKAVQTGGGRQAYIEGIQVGGKSGTSQKIVDGKYSREVVTVSFLGVAPIENPKYLVLVVVDEPKDMLLGSLVAGPVVKNILEDIFRYEDIIPEVEVPKDVVVPNLLNLSLKEAYAVLDKLGLSHATVPVKVEDLNSIVHKQFPEAGKSINGDGLVILSIEAVE